MRSTPVDSGPLPACRANRLTGDRRENAARMACRVDNTPNPRRRKRPWAADNARFPARPWSRADDRPRMETTSMTNENATTHDIPALARALRAALGGEAIKIRHTNALDLIAAALGARSRQALAITTLAATPSTYLEAVATRFARHDEARLRAICLATTALTHPARDLTFRSDACGMDLALTLADMSEPEGFLQDTAMGQAILTAIADKFYYARWSDPVQRSPYDLKRMNKIARAFLDLRRAEPGSSPLALLEEASEHAFSPNEATDDIHDQGTGVIDDLVSEIGDALADAAAGSAQFDAGEWEDAIERGVVGLLEDGDTSSVADIFGDSDRCEVVFLFGDPEAEWEDGAISCIDHHGTPGVDHNLQRQLAGLGYTITEFRAQTGNASPANGRLTRVAVRATKLVTPEELSTLVDNAGSDNWSFCVYAQVPIVQLVNLDPKGSIAFDRATVGVYNPMSGTFFDTGRKTDVVLPPSAGRLVSPGGWYGPDDICGLVGSAYATNVRNA